MYVLHLCTHDIYICKYALPLDRQKHAKPIVWTRSGGMTNELGETDSFSSGGCLYLSTAS